MLNIRHEARITGRTVEQVQGDRDAQRATLDWFNAQITALGFDPLAYTGALIGTPEWVALNPEDPERLAAVLIAARAQLLQLIDLPEAIAYDAVVQDAIGRELYLDAVEPANELARAMARDLARTPSYAERVALRTNYPPVHEVQATADWTPVQIPGRPGWWRHFVNGQQVDLPTTNASEAAA